MLFISMVLVSCSSPPDLEIGFIADVSSGQTKLGMQCRNAVLLAIEDINAEGGILGRKVLLNVQDNGNDPNRHEEIVAELEKQGVEFVIGPFLSQMADSLLSQVNGKNMLLISPVVSSDLYSGIDDNFFVIQPRASSDGRQIGYAVVGKGDKTVALVRSSSNDLYTDWFMSGVRDVLNEHSVSIVYDKTFSSSSELVQIAEDLLKLEPDGLVFSSLGIDAAAAIQQYAKEKSPPHLYGDEWSKTTDLLSYGGRTVESMISAGVYNSNRNKDLEKQFLERYKARYSHEPTFFASFAFEAIMILKDAIERSGKNYSINGVKTHLIEIDDFIGIMGPLDFDEYGDSSRKKRLYMVKDNQYVPY